GSLTCWGSLAGLLPASRLPPTPTGSLPIDPRPLAGPVDARSPTISEGIPCALDGAGHPWCWAQRDRGVLQRAAEPLDLGPRGAARLLATPGAEQGCALVPRGDGAGLECWSLAARPSEAAASADSNDSILAALHVPETPAGVGLRALALAAGSSPRSGDLAGCLLRDDDAVACWQADGQQPWRDELAALARGQWATEPGVACRGLDGDDDGRPDAEDRCPDQAEVYNGVDDHDGCPDDPPSLVRVDERAGRIELLAKVEFRIDHDDILPRSFELLRHLAAALDGYPRISRLEIQGHADDRHEDHYGRRPTQRRAQSVAKFLIQQGVDPARLEARGYGETRPIADNRTAEGRALNRRIEIVILEWSD
ncbi:MAG: OmpA family protein, partial [Myxococcales bacterium]|nr:OmpA family protein [Myxococcales bacterium]